MARRPRLLAPALCTAALLPMAIADCHLDPDMIGPGRCANCGLRGAVMRTYPVGDEHNGYCHTEHVCNGDEPCVIPGSNFCAVDCGPGYAMVERDRDGPDPGFHCDRDIPGHSDGVLDDAHLPDCERASPRSGPSRDRPD